MRAVSDIIYSLTIVKNASRYGHLIVMYKPTLAVELIRSNYATHNTYAHIL